MIKIADKFSTNYSVFCFQIRKKTDFFFFNSPSPSYAKKARINVKNIGLKVRDSIAVPLQLI